MNDMAPTTRGSVVDGAERELQVEIYKRGWDWWVGTSAQLQAEGLIAPGFEFPQGKEQRLWVSGAFDFLLSRCRPEGHRGPPSSWLQIDYWRCRRTLVAQRGDGFANARDYEKRLAIAKGLWSQTPAGREEFSMYLEACEDQAFQAFIGALIPKRKRPGRKSKPKPDLSPTNQQASPQ